LQLDLNSILQLINNIAGLVNIETVTRNATIMMEECPSSFIVAEFVFDLEQQMQEVDTLR
jgi:hypothetical protein